MTEMWTSSPKCSLVVILVVYAFFVGSGTHAENGDNSGAFASASAIAYAGAGASALSSAGAFTGTSGGIENVPGAHNGHKGIRSYNSRDNNANRGTKSYGTPSVDDAGLDHGKGRDHNYNKHGDDCSKCKWENDEYWEREEPEEEGDENDGDVCDDGDDGQYKPDKTHRHGPSAPGRHKPGSHPPGVYKTGPTDVYTDSEIQGENRPSGPFGGFPASTAGYPGPTGTTSKYGSGWSTPFAETSKPAYGSVPTGTFETTLSPRPDWNRGTTPASYGSTPRPAWGSGHDRIPAGSFVTTPKPGASWNAGSGAPTGGFPSSQKPEAPWNTEHSTPAVSFSTTVKPAQGWNTGYDGTPTAGFPSSRKSAPSWNVDRDNIPGSSGITPKPGSNWNTGFDNTGGLPSTRKPETPWNIGHDGGNFGTTPKPGQGWNTGVGDKPGPSWSPDYGTKPVSTSSCPRPDSSCNQEKQVPVKVGATPIAIDLTPPHVESGVSPLDNYGPYGPYGPGTQSTSTYSGASVTPGSGTPDFGRKDHPFGLNKPTYTQTPYDNKPYDGIAHPNIGSGIYGPGVTPDYNKPGHGSRPLSTWPSSGENTFGTTKGPYGGISSPGTVPGVQGNIFLSPGKPPGSPTGSSVYEQPDVTKPSYGSEPFNVKPWLNNGWPGSNWHGPGTTGPYAEFPTSNTGFGTTKTPFGHVSTPGPTSSGSPYGGTGPKQSSFNIASSSATASAGASTFGTSFGTHSTPSITGTTPAYGGGHPVYSGIKGSSGIRPTYRPIVPHDTNVGTGAWPDKQPGSGSGTWPVKQPVSGNETPGGYPGAVSGTWPGASGIRPGGQPGSGSNTWPSAQSGGNVPWPGNQPGSGSGTAGYPETGIGTGPNKPPGIGSGTWPTGQPGPSKPPGIGSGTWSTGQPGPSKPPGIGSGPWPTGQPGPSKPFGIGSGPWPTRQPGLSKPPGIGSGTWPTGQPGPSKPPGIGTGTWPTGQPGPSKPPGIGSGPWPTGQPGPNQPGDGSESWPGRQPGSGCSSCASATGPHAGSSNCESGNHNCGSGCGARDNNAPVIHGPCDGATDGPSGVNKTYYPAGTGDGNVPSIANQYGPNSPPNIGIGPYPGANTGCGGGDYTSCNQVGGSVTPDGPVQWNRANPFLYGAGGGTPSDVSRPWSSGTTPKPFGGGNPFFDSNWSGPKPGYSSSNANDDRNVIPLEEGNRPIGQGNPFLDDSKRRGDTDVEGVIPLGGRKPGGNNPFIGPGSGSSGLSGPSYGGYPDRSSGSGLPGSGGYGNVKGGSRPGGVSPQHGNNDRSYSTGGSPQSPSPLQCKLGLFGCGTSGSGSGKPLPGGGVYGGIGGNVETGDPANIGSVPGGHGSPGIGIGPDHFGPGRPRPNNLAPSAGGAYAGAYAGSFAQASNFGSAKSLPFSGPGNDFGQTQSGNWPPSGAQNQAGPNSWASSGAFASSSSGSWSGNYPADVRG